MRLEQMVTWSTFARILSSSSNHSHCRPIHLKDAMEKKITEKIAALPPDANYFSLEFFPPKTRMGFANLSARLERMAQALRPLFVTVTWGAGGSTAARSLELAEVCQRQLQLTTVLHLTCTNMSRKLVDMALDEAKVLGIRNILALRGDPPRSEEYNMHGEDDSNKDFTFAVDLVRYIRQTHGDYFCVGVAAYPEGHPADNFQDVQDPARDIPSLVEKTQAGADFIMTQLTYDIDAYQKFEEMLRNHESGAFKTIPIIPGLMPIHSYKILTRVTKLSHVTIPPPIAKRMEELKHDDDAVKRAGVDIVSEIVGGVRDIPSPGPRGFHFYTLNLEKTVSFILEQCDLIPSYSDAGDTAIADDPASIPLDFPGRALRRRRASSINSQPHNRVIVDKLSVHESSQDSVHEALADSAGVPAPPPNRSTTLLISEGLGALGREATWDDFPNGRWGDARSPAFGEIDGYGPSLHVTANTARRLWGHPVDSKDMSAIFRRHVSGELHMVPWSEGGAEEDGEGLNAETELIRPELLKLIDGRGWWTLASQPAVNGVHNDHPIFGWGPQREGFVFQKPFVEFFCSSNDYTNILKPLFAKHGHDKLTWFATNVKGDFESSLPAQPADMDLDDLGSNPESVNAVTWGVFRGKEIVTPTIIEEVSFRAWGEEAFRIWDEWRRIYPRGSPTETYLDTTKNDSWLVCVVGQQFGAGTKQGSKEEEDEVKWMWRVLAGEEA